MQRKMVETFIQGSTRGQEYPSPWRSMGALVDQYGPHGGMEFDPETFAARQCLRIFHCD